MIFLWILVCKSMRDEEWEEYLKKQKEDPLHFVQFSKQKDFGFQKRYPFNTLVFITPWNNRGYQFAKKYINKIDILSPVWYYYQQNNGGIQLKGTDDIQFQRKFISQIRNLSSKIKITPRIYIDKIQIFIALLENQELKIKYLSYLQTIASFTDGIIFDSPFLPIYQKFQYFNTHIIKLVQMTNQHLAGKLLILSLGSPQLPQNQYQLSGLLQNCDYFTVSNYDYRDNGKNSYGLAPPWWIVKNFQLYEKFGKEKMFMGLPFYGYKRSSNANAISGQQFLKQKFKKARFTKIKQCQYILESQGGSIFFPCLNFLNERLNYFKQKQVGVMIWEGGNGLQSQYKVL